MKRILILGCLLSSVFSSAMAFTVYDDYGTPYYIPVIKGKNPAIQAAETRIINKFYGVKPPETPDEKNKKDIDNVINEVTKGETKHE